MKQVNKIKTSLVVGIMLTLSSNVPQTLIGTQHISILSYNDICLAQILSHWYEWNAFHMSTRNKIRISLNEVIRYKIWKVVE